MEGEIETHKDNYKCMVHDSWRDNLICHRERARDATVNVSLETMETYFDQLKDVLEEYA